MFPHLFCLFSKSTVYIKNLSGIWSECHFGFRSGLTFCHAWYGSKLLAKVTSGPVSVLTVCKGDQQATKLTTSKQLLNLLLQNNGFWWLWNIMYLKIIWKMEPLLQGKQILYFSYNFHRHNISKLQFSIIFSKVFKTFKFSWFFSMLSKNGKWCHLKIAYGVKG